MNEKQALEVIKAALDLGVQKGNFVNLNETFVIIQAFELLSKHFQEKKDENVNASN